MMINIKIQEQHMHLLYYQMEDDVMYSREHSDWHSASQLIIESILIFLHSLFKLY